MKARRLSVLIVATAFVASGAFAQAPLQQSKELCASATDHLDVRIGACTALIQSGKLGQENLSLALNNRSVPLRLKRDYSAAMSDLDAAIKLSPKNHLAHYNKALVFLATGQMEKAITSASDAIRLNPSAGGPYVTRGQAYYNIKKFDEAIQDSNEAIKLASTRQVEAIWTRGMAYREKKQYSDALADFNELSQLMPKAIGPLEARAGIYRSLKRRDEAIAEYSKIIEINPNFAPAYLGRAAVYRDNLGESDEKALADLDAAIRIAPKEYFARYSRGIYHFSHRDLDKAMADFDEAISLNPSYAYAYASRGRTQAKKGNKAAAIADLKKALEIDPKLDYAQQWLQEAEGQN
jgi:tetratricopeptide (TPR) repeat protein